SIGGRYTIHNTGTTSEEIRLDMVGDALTDKKSDLAIITLISQSHALSLGRYPNIEPVVMLENAQTSAHTGKTQPIIGATLTIEGGKTAQIRFVHSGLGRMNDSLERATYWLAQDWDVAFATITQASSTIPHIETGNAETDALIALSYHHLIQAFISPT
ncbi:MAG TPA: hypothetical protein PLZ51_23665, partial [Aggregatilineales bacterium]|nr:hypothetical protein [Aggregatilineales bacterium]